MDNSQLPDQIVGIITKLGIKDRHQLGEGGEGYIFDYSDNKVLKIYPKADLDYLQKLQSFQNLLQKYSLPYNIPLITKIDCIDNTYFTIENKFKGQQLDFVFPGLSGNQKLQVLKNYFEAIVPFNSIELPDYPYGQILNIKDSIRSDSWSGFLVNKLNQKLIKSDTYLPEDIYNYDEKVALIIKIIKQNCSNTRKNLVHCDYYLNNVLVNENLEISTVLDFSVHASVGDKRIDVASLAYLNLDKNITPGHINFLLDFAKELYGYDINKFITIYGLYYAFYYADTHDFNLNSYKWCINYINDTNHWKLIS